ncbi:MAG: amino acid permease [Alphaproteobacteria bacterium]|nr:amino acid permease [Alphaproteobacteria bacterium]
MRLTRRLGLFEGVALSLSVIAPTMAMAFNVTLAAQAAGRAAPLAFAVGTAVVAVVGLAFVSFARRTAHAGSAYAYLRASFGPRAGFLAGWLLLLTYLCFATATAGLTGNFLQAALANHGIGTRWIWLPVSAASVVLAVAFAYRDMRLAGRLMLVLELVSVCALLALSALILYRVGAAGGLSLAPFRPDAAAGGWAGVGFGIVYTVLSFAGFEGATTLGEEMRSPYRDIPRAVLGTVLVAGVFYVLVSYTQVVGFGLDRVGALAASDAPLNDLSLRFASAGVATAIDLAAALSAFACTLGALSAAARMLFALGRGGGWPAVGTVHPVHGTPAWAVAACGVLALAALLVIAPQVGVANYYGYAGTLGTLALIVVYLGVAAGSVRPAPGASLRWSGAAGVVLLLWPLGNSLVPLPPFPYNLLPYAVLLWAAAGAALMTLRPAVIEALPEAE